MATQPHPDIEKPAAVPFVDEKSGISRRDNVKRSRFKFRRIYLIPIALLLILGAVLLWLYFSSYESTDDGQVDVHLYPVSPRISGYVIKVNVDDNQYVHQGDVLVEIDPKDYEIAIAKARADLANAEATAKSFNITVPITSVNTSSQLKSAESDVSNATAGIVTAEKQLAAAHAQVEQAEANDVKAQDDLKRYKRLVEKQNVSEQTYVQAVAAAKASTASVAAARANEAGGNRQSNRRKTGLRKPKPTVERPKLVPNRWLQPMPALWLRWRMSSNGEPL
jgi:membrane fusion protein (multidrug efflux system)